MADQSTPAIKNTMTEIQHQKAISWMVENAPNFKCEVCTSDHFDVLYDFVSFPIIGTDGVPEDVEHFFPAFMVVCSKCGNTKFINAMKSNVMERNTNVHEPTPQVSSVSKEQENRNG